MSKLWDLGMEVVGLGLGTTHEEVKECQRRIRLAFKDEEFRDLAFYFLAERLIYQCRNKSSRSAKEKAADPIIVGSHGLNGHSLNGVAHQPKPILAANCKASKILQEAAGLYMMCIGGVRLGDVKGNELPGLIEKERAFVAGHAKNLLLFESLLPLVPEDKTVRQSVTVNKLNELWQSAVRRSLKKHLAEAGC